MKLLNVGRIIALSVITLALNTVQSCKTNEENYRSAYEKAKEKDRAGLDSTVYSRIRHEARPANVVVGGDTLNMRSEYVRITDGQEIMQSELKRYDVVVAQFKQLFHAKSMRRRMAEGGWNGAFIVETREPLYYVVAFATDDPADAALARDSLLRQSPVALTDPCPWVLRPANR